MLSRAARIRQLLIEGKHTDDEIVAILHKENYEPGNFIGSIRGERWAMKNGRRNEILPVQPPAPQSPIKSRALTLAIKVRQNATLVGGTANFEKLLNLCVKHGTENVAEIVAACSASDAVNNCLQFLADSNLASVAEALMAIKEIEKEQES